MGGKPLLGSKRSKRIAFAMGGIIFVGLTGLVLLELERTHPSSLRWKLLSGQLSRLGQVQALPLGGEVSPGEYTAKEGVALSSGSIRLEVERLSTLLVRPGRALPSVLSGRIAIRASEAVFLGSLEVLPLEEARLVLEPGSLIVEEGRGRVSGQS